MKPQVSVILVTYNRESLICDAIASVLRQTYRDWELLVVDDGSTDGTQAVVKNCRLEDPRVWYFQNARNFGIVASRQRALNEAAGKYVAVIDSDDVWVDEDKLAKQVDFLERHPDHVLVGGGVVIVDESGKEKSRYLNPETDRMIRRTILAKNPFAHSTVLYRVEAARKVGGYEPMGSEDKSDGAEDYDLFLRLGLEGKVANLPEYFAQYRVHDGNATNERLLSMMRKNLALVKKYGSKYPGFCWAWLRRTVRLLVASILLERMR